MPNRATTKNADLFLWLTAIVFLMAGSPVAFATILLNESFTYTNGPLVVASGTNWQTFSGTAGQIVVSNSQARLVLNNSEDVETWLSPPPSTDILYAGFTLRCTTLPSGGGGYFAMLKDTGTSSDFRARVWAFTNGAATGKFRLGLSSVTSTLNVTNPANLNLNADYRIVVRFENVTGSASLWIDPAQETDPAVTTSEASSSSTATKFAFRQGSSGSAQLTVDDLIVGESFQEVISTNPPPQAPLATPYLSILSYNAHGSTIPDWTTNSAQVQAIGRQIVHLDPDIITFQEIPITNNGWAEMPNFVLAFRPGFALATNSAQDGFIRSVILSRFPITRSQSWLHSADLKPFGYTNTATSLADNFTRDLFEAEIVVPGFAEPLHVFTVHLKSGSGDDAKKRAAEARAVSNYFATTFVPAYSNRPYVLTGDVNEDLAQPSGDGLAIIQQLANNDTRLTLTTPRNAVTHEFRTFSIRDAGGLAKRYDYIMPCPLLSSNFAGGEVFRSDTLNPVPPNLFTNDSATASDHLPVLVRFGNPYVEALPHLTVQAVGDMITLNWNSTSNVIYGVDSSTNLSTWSTLLSNLLASGTNLSFSTNATTPRSFFRVYRVQ